MCWALFECGDGSIENNSRTSGPFANQKTAITFEGAVAFVPRGNTKLLVSESVDLTGNRSKKSESDPEAETELYASGVEVDDFENGEKFKHRRTAPVEPEEHESMTTQVVTDTENKFIVLANLT